MARRAAGPLVCLILSLSLYVATLAPTVTSEDSGELIAAAYFFGVPHPPGYPLWTLTCGLFSHILPVGSFAWRCNLFSAVCAACALAILCRCLLLLGTGSRVAVASALLVAVGSTFWSQSVIAEVYGLNSLFVSLLLWCTIRWYLDRREIWLVLACALTGLGMCNHQTIGIVAAGLGIGVLTLSPRLLLRPKLIALSIASFLVALAPHLYLPIRARAETPVNWGDPKDAKSTWRHVSRAQYKGTQEPPDLMQENAGPSYAHQLLLGGRLLVEDQSAFVAALCLVGLAAIAVRRRPLILFAAVPTLFYALVFLSMNGIGTSRQDLWVIRVFFLPVYMLLGIPLAMGFQVLVDAACKAVGNLRKRSTSRWASAVGWCLAVTPAIALGAAHLHECNFRNYWFAYDHALNLLRSALPNAILIPSGDHNTFPLLYATTVEGLRPDVTIADKYGYIDPALYATMPELGGKLPRTLEERDAIESWIIHTARRPVYYTVKRDSLASNARLMPVGILYHLLPGSKTLEVDEVWATIRYRNITDSLKSALDYGAANILSDYEFFAGLYALERDDKPEALEHFERAAGHGWGIKEVLNNIGCALSEHGMRDSAIVYFRSAARLDPLYRAARWNLARLLKSGEEWQEAEAVFLTLAELDPSDFRVFGELGFLGMRLGRSPELVRERLVRSLQFNADQREISEALAQLDDPSAPIAIEAQSLPADAENSSSDPQLKPTGAPTTAWIAMDNMWSAGKVPLGVSTQHEFRLRYMGPDPGRIATTESAVPWLSLDEPTKLVRPGDEVTILVRLELTELGPQSGTVSLGTDSPEQPNIDFTVTADGMPPIEAIPAALRIDASRPAESVESRLVLKNQAAKAFRILRIEALAPLHAVFEANMARVEHDVVVRADPWALFSPRDLDLKVLTDFAAQAEVLVQVQLEPPPPLSVRPSIASFGRIAKESRHERTIEVWATDPAQLRIVAAQTEPGIHIELDPVGVSAHMRTLRILLDAAQVSKSVVYQAVTIETTGASSSRTVVHIYADIAR